MLFPKLESRIDDNITVLDRTEVDEFSSATLLLIIFKNLLVDEMSKKVVACS